MNLAIQRMMLMKVIWRNKFYELSGSYTNGVGKTQLFSQRICHLIQLILALTLQCKNLQSANKARFPKKLALDYKQLFNNCVSISGKIAA